jgi:hypothetical protein
MTSALYAVAEERRKILGLSMNAYVARCIQAEIDASEPCAACNHRAVSESVLVTLDAAERLKKAKRKR